MSHEVICRHTETHWSSAAVQFAHQAIAIDPEFWIGYFHLGQRTSKWGKLIWPSMHLTTQDGSAVATAKQ
jgi:hypothetical protein